MIKFDKIFTKQVVAPILIIFFSFLFYIIIKTIIKRLLKIKTNRHVDTKKIATISSIILNIIKFFIIIVASIMILDIYGVDTKSILASLGVFTAVLALSLQDILKDFVAGISIILEGQYRIGDTITVNDFKGEVISFSLKSTRLKAYTGEIKILANRNISEVINHSFSSSLAIVDVGVSYDSDLNKVDDVLNKLCEKLSNEIEELDGEVKVLGVNELGSSSVNYRITALTKSMKHIAVQRKIMRAVKDEFSKNGIEIPYNQVVVHNG